VLSLLLCISSSCVPYCASFSGLSIFEYPYVVCYSGLSIYTTKATAQYVWDTTIHTQAYRNIVTFLFSRLQTSNRRFRTRSLKIDIIMHIKDCVSINFFVLCTLLCQFLWIVHFWLPFRYSPMFIFYMLNRIIFFMSVFIIVLLPYSGIDYLDISDISC
jgi:hypothetical protein